MPGASRLDHLFAGWLIWASQTGEENWNLRVFTHRVITVTGHSHQVQHVKWHEVQHNITGLNIPVTQTCPNATPSINRAIRRSYMIIWHFPSSFLAEAQGSTYRVSHSKRSPVHCSMDPIEHTNSDHVAVQLQGGEPCWRSQTEPKMLIKINHFHTFSLF